MYATATSGEEQGMYTTYFGFNSKPFKPKDLKDYYRNANFDDACADILDSIREKRGFILLTGEAGVGKTLVLRRCMAEASDVRFIRLVNANLDFPDILNYLCTGLELPIDGLDAGQQERLLLDTLVVQARRHQTIALLVDDAQHLASDALLRLQEFVETPVMPSQRLQVVLVGLPELVSRLDQPEFRRLRDTIRSHCQLEPLDQRETERFIDHQLKVAGWEGDGLLSPAAVERIWFYCKGVPRAIAILCDSVLLLASLQSEHDITPALVDEAAQSCFLGEQQSRLVPDRSTQDGDASKQESDLLFGTSPVADADFPEFDLDLSEFDFSFDVDQQIMRPKSSAAAMPAVELTFRSERSPPSPPVVAAEPAIGTEVDQTQAVKVLLVKPDPSFELPEAIATNALHQSTSAVSPFPVPSSDEFVQLLNELTGKLDRHHPRHQQAVRYFLNRYLRLAQGKEPARTLVFESRMARLIEIQQPLLVGLVTAVKAWSGQEGVLCALLINPTWWLYREIRLRLRGADLMFADDGRIPPLRLLDGRDAQVAYLSYRSPFAGLAQTLLWLEVDLCDHRGEWIAYNGRYQIRLDLPDQPDVGRSKEASSSTGYDCFWPEPSTASRPDASWLVIDSVADGDGATTASQDVGDLVCTLPLELEVDAARTARLRDVSARGVGRGTLLTRALLLATDPSQAPARIELVSRPFMIFGRHSSTAGTGFGDFTLGFVPKYTRISRLHCVICALGDQLALMPASDVGRTYTGRNGQRLAQGSWEFLEADDVLEICDLYRLKLVLAWERKWEPAPATWDARQPREKFGRYLLGLVDVLRQRDQQVGAEDLRKTLRQRYLNLLRVQDRVSQLNGVGNPGSLLYARFEREDAARRQIVHFYIPKWVSVGSSPQVGLRVEAEGVSPHHAELLFRDGMYWIQNLAAPDSVRVGHHGLATNEVLALEAGDMLMIGAARFTFEAY
ncbi:MAG TPA: AAA family ATPase [Candidatus Competibacter sp.]|nr:AAA family ATPase [Candidatus Competibacter sp.]